MVFFAICCILYTPKSKCAYVYNGKSGQETVLANCVCLGAVIIGCIVPMGMATTWNGEPPGHEKQYEHLAEVILEGHLYIDDGNIDEKLLEMENPYDPEARDALNVAYEWDHSFYNGHYYMYFGVVPVFLLFLPFRILTGTSLVTYKATQIFAAFFIAGIFALFKLLSKKFFPKMSLGMYVTMSAAFSFMSIWCSIGVPGMYCTAIVSALCMEVWSFYFFVRAVWIEERQKKTIVYAFFGSLFGALAFGCRPSIALANILVLPMLIVYLKSRKINRELVLQLLIAAMPYFIIGILLMLYNYVRFDNPLEFGQSYQLTLADLSNSGDAINLITVFNGIRESFLACNPMRERFPYFTHSGVIVNFPILLLTVVGVMHKRVWVYMKEKQLSLVVLVLFVLPVIITGIDVMWTASIIERYRMDIYWLLGILCFIVVGIYYMNMAEDVRKKFASFVSFFSVYTILSSVLYFISNNSANFSINWPGALEAIQSVLTLGMR